MQAWNLLQLSVGAAKPNATRNAKTKRPQAEPQMGKQKLRAE